jgi:solute carrier family 25 folate transporter 32
MNPLDLLKVKFQVMTSKPVGGVGKQILLSLREIYQVAGVKGLYRGLIPNIAGNAASWGLYFWFYNILKRNASGNDPDQKLSAGTYLICSAEASAVTAVLTNPLWLVRVRMFASQPSAPAPYRGLYNGLSTIYQTEGFRGLFRGTTLALVGVSNGAVQFVVYEKMKQWGFDRKRKRFERAGIPWTADVDRLSNFAYSLMSISSKIVALSVTYPYQVVRSRLQNDGLKKTFPDIPTTIKRTWSSDGIKGFYRGLGTNMVRVLPGTCITFVVYENLAWLLRTTAAKRQAHV